MYKKILSALFVALLLTPAAYAKISVTGYSTPAPAGKVDLLVRDVIISADRDDAGNIVSDKHNVIKVAFEKEHNFLLLKFNEEDFNTGLAFMKVIGKPVVVSLNRDHDAFIVEEIYVK